MNDKQKLLLTKALLILQILLGFAWIPGLWAIEREKLLFKEIPIVITASRKKQPITQAASTITVITADDIKYSGATTIPEVLSLVAGVDVMTITPRDQQVGVRGFISPMNNKVLLMVDGRSMYTDLFGAIFWNLLPIGLQEIERIEVVKSPASSIYGANAFSGAINIITKSPQDLRGTTLHFSGGGNEAFITSVLHAGSTRGNRFTYKISAEWDQTREAVADDRPTPATLRANTLLQYTLNKNDYLTLSAGYSQSQNGRFLSGGAMGTGLIDYDSSYLQLDINLHQFQFRTFYRHETPSINWPITNDMQNWHIDAIQSEILHTTTIGLRHSLVWGLSHQYNRLKKNIFITNNQKQNLWGIFIEDEFKISRALRLTAGLRFDEHPLVHGHISPRISFLFTPNPTHAIRISVTQAFRNPSLEDSYIYIKKESTFNMPPSPTPVAFTFIRQGNTELNPEVITSHEIGYRIVPSHHLTLDINLFYNLYRDFFATANTMSYYEPNELFPGSPGGVIHKEVISSIQNQGKSEGFGGEITAAFILHNNISGFINYSYQSIQDKVNHSYQKRTENPTHKCNAGLRLLLDNGLSFNATAHWVDKTVKLLPGNNGQNILAPIDAYILVNTRLGFTFWRQKAEVAVSVLNLFNNQHYEYPHSDASHYPESISIGRRFAFTLKIKL